MFYGWLIDIVCFSYGIEMSGMCPTIECQSVRHDTLTRERQTFHQGVILYRETFYRETIYRETFYRDPLTTKYELRNILKPQKHLFRLKYRFDFHSKNNQRLLLDGMQLTSSLSFSKQYKKSRSLQRPLSLVG